MHKMTCSEFKKAGYKKESLLIETPDDNLSDGMGQLNGIYIQRSSRCLERASHVF